MDILLATFHLVHELVVVVVDFSQNTPLEIFSGHLQIKILFYCLVIGINWVLGWFRSFPVKLVSLFEI